MNNNIFERHELKFLINEWQRRFLEQALRERIVPDPHGESTVCNVYYDTPDFRLIRASLEKPVYKEKLRLRSYGPALPDDPVFLELKKKYRGIVYKRRISVTEQEAVDFLNGAASLPEESQISREIDYFVQFYQDLGPAMYLSYDRAAFFSREDPDLRVTFDKKIRWRTEDLRLSEKPGGASILAPGQSLMEIKAADAIPLWLVDLLNEGQIRQISFSKYGRAYMSMLEGTYKESRGVLFA
ncbi:MAG TPA: polyphosphate polymerase domain-containing protein [Oscillospiraceae bacterium]|mgnify:CR=1 FL=1|nr:polyphosphate polymerase domain-containing protein [Oscillospiraceae bacterium]HRW57171.1 polyphosphate polymerase domain-containing protein [Oscillospiraceae bacterium]